MSLQILKGLVFLLFIFQVSNRNTMCQEINHPDEVIGTSFSVMDGKLEDLISVIYHEIKLNEGTPDRSYTYSIYVPLEIDSSFIDDELVLSQKISNYTLSYGSDYSNTMVVISELNQVKSYLVYIDKFEEARYYIVHNFGPPDDVFKKRKN